ncbi:hypothetical protein CRG98_021449 [Punica granatum]|uniref:Myb/SANT-like domain-containing protein n=1 Tax=Punica granatum TaxID=22663 RepID=A0A2I0JPI2_PUNGR|nr:hypothetical protein CRG98_021449 [Punica granatum]
MAPKGEGIVEWTDQLEEALIEIMVDKFQRTHTSSWKWKNWEQMNTELEQKFPGVTLGADKLRAKSRRMKSQYSQFTELIQHTRVGWDEQTNTVKASPDIWDKFIRHCIGAMDGTHVLAIMPASVRGAYRDRNGDIMQNVLAICSHQMIFTYVMSGWEGSAHDSRILSDAATLPEFPAPRGGQRYHRSDFNNDNPPTTKEELFNQRHASVRNDRLFAEYGDAWQYYDEFRNPPHQNGVRNDVDMRSRAMDAVRDRIANQIWHAERGEHLNM